MSLRWIFVLQLRAEIVYNTGRLSLVLVSCLKLELLDCPDLRIKF